MKNSLFIIVCCVIFAGCAKKNNAANQPLIIGHWAYTNDVVRTYFADTLFTTDVTDAHDSYYQFNADGTGVTYFHDNDARTTTFTYQVDANNLTIHFAASRSDLGMTTPAYTAIPKISSLTEHQLVIVYDSGVSTDASHREDIETITLNK